ncbi:MAG: hypothetical protein JRM77_10020 [Nitrososphaerota archaeon]|jgi:hypothetical protein|nr:hypothetical protein [Nitrososphaerota archaeon]
MVRNHLLWCPDPVYAKLRRLRDETGYPSFGALLNALALEHDGAAEAKATLPLVLADRRPFVITGPSGSGKTSFAKRVLEAWTGPALCFDVSDEYPDLPTIKDSRDIPFKEGGRLRILADPDASYSAVQGSYLFRDLARAKSPELAKWLVIIEEAHRFTGDANLRDLILESRKTLGKLLVLSADASAWLQVAPVVRA